MPQDLTLAIKPLPAFLQWVAAIPPLLHNFLQLNVRTFTTLHSCAPPYRCTFKPFWGNASPHSPALHVLAQHACQNFMRETAGAYLRMLLNAC